MAYTGVFCTEAEMQFKAGEKVDATGDIQANHEQLAEEIENYINVLCRYDFVTNYASLTTETKGLLREAASNYGAIYLIQYNMEGYSPKSIAESMVNILWARLEKCLKLLEDQKSVKYMGGT